MSDLDYLGFLTVPDGTLRDVHNVENQWLKQVSDLEGLNNQTLVEIEQ